MGMRKRWVSVLALFLLLLPLAAAALTPSGKVHEVRIKGRIEIGPDGQVVDYRPSRDLPAVISNAVDANVRSWTFEPVVIDGRAVTAETGVLLVLDARERSDGGLALRIKDVAFGAPEGSVEKAHPRYPVDALRSSIEARVILVMRVDGDGDVLDVAVEQTSLSRHVKPRHAQTYADMFEAASIDVAWRWRFGTRESVDGVPVEDTVRVPVEYLVGSRTPRFTPGPVRVAPWRAESPPALPSELAALASDDIRSLDSVFKLRSGVLGTEI
ncbi:hypothetical protein [Luteimonas sp. A649]